MKKFFIGFAVLLFFALVVFTGYYFVKKAQKPTVEFNTQQAFTTDIVNKTVATGSIRPKEEIEIKPAVSGIITQLFVFPGEFVTKGQTLAKIQIIPNLVNLNNAETSLANAEIDLEESQREFDRQEELFSKNVISERDFTQAKFTLNRANERVSSSKNNLLLVREGATKNAKQASNLVRSTVDGMILEVPVEVGKSVIEANNFNDGTTIAAIADMKDMIFEGLVDESEVGKLKEGMALVLTIGAIPDEKFDAVLNYISPKGVEDEGSIKFEIKALVSLKDNKFIRAGYSANADIVLDKKDSVFAIKESVLQFDKDGTAFIEVQTGEQQFERREIKLGLSDGINVEVLEGVTKEDFIKAEEKRKDAKKGTQRGRRNS